MDRCLPISAYGIIGNVRTAALIGNNGSVDWLCLPEIDGGSVFGALLDADRGGRFMVGPAGGGPGEQEYIEDTNVLRTMFREDAGALVITDLMPLWGDLFPGGRTNAPPEMLRLLECLSGTVEVEVEWSPRFDYARKTPNVWKSRDGWVAEAEGEMMSLGGLRPEEVRLDERRASVLGSIGMTAGERRVLVTRWGTQRTDHDIAEADELLGRTVATWRSWAHGGDPVHDREWAREHYDLLMRSELVLKLMTNAETGAIVAAPTTSLPEALGGQRNYDYRYAWVRDASLTAQALISLGHEREGLDFLFWIERVSTEHFEENGGPQIMYGIRGESDLDEMELTHLEGYRGSQPVRVGNAAAKQLQLEVYGEILNTAYELVRRGFRLEDRIIRYLGKVTEHVCEVWKEPDHGIWEIRGEPRHFTYSKVMLWVALDRAIQVSKVQDIEGDKQEWRRVRREIKESVLRNGYDPELGSFVQSYGSKVLDAANLRIPLLEFLPFDDPRVQGTIDRTMVTLTENGLVHRYLDDELDGWGDEGAFGICTCWLVEALALSGRVEEARRTFDDLIGRASRLGLFSEQIDPATGMFLGNYPQAFTHLGIINNILYLAYAGGSRVPEHPLIGTREHRESVSRPTTSIGPKLAFRSVVRP